MKKTPREKAEDREDLILGRFAVKSIDSRGRDKPEGPCPVRTAFQVDCHRIVHCKAFRRLKGKTQVFLWPEGDHYRTRLTHCQEVSQIARTLARSLDLNEDLTEAIALGHDLGHTPFGHAGEEVMQKLYPGFRHEQQSLRVVERLENDGHGLNLTSEVRDGILKHSKGAGPLIPVSKDRLPNTLEGQVVRFADVVAYVNHDLDDALRAKVVAEEELPASVNGALGSTHSERITGLILDIAASTELDKEAVISMSERAEHALDELRSFLYKKVYYNDRVHAEFRKASDLIGNLWKHFAEDADRFYDEYWTGALKDGALEDDIKDFLAGMTDAFAVNLHDRIFTPRRWYVL